MAKCEDNGYRLVPTAGRAFLVSVINSSRLVPDIKRDLARFQGIYIARLMFLFLFLFRGR